VSALWLRLRVFCSFTGDVSCVNKFGLSPLHQARRQFILVGHFVHEW
jgi:hypothetical protein